MTWTKLDQERLQDFGESIEEYYCQAETFADAIDGQRIQRAAAHIEALAARVAMLEKKYDCHPQGGVIGCDCWECLRVEIARLRAVCAEVAGELRGHEEQARETGCLYSANRMGAIADRLDKEAGGQVSGGEGGGK